MNKINLNNDKLRAYIQQVLGKNRYGQPWDTLVEEFFLREQYVLNLTIDEFTEDLQNFKNSVKGFGFSNKNYSATGTWFGAYIPKTETIEFNEKYWKHVKKHYSKEQYCEMFAETFFHECLHGTQSGMFGNNRAEKYNYTIGNRGHAIYEICTQATAAKMARNRDRTEFFTNNILTGDGYSDEIFSVGLLSAAFGVNERDVLKYGCRPREELIGVLNENIGDINLTSQFVDSIENQLEFMHSVQYPDSNQTKFINMNDIEKSNNLTQCIKNLLQISQQVMVTRIQKVPSNLDENVVIKLNSNQKKMYDILNNQFQMFGEVYNNDYASFMIAMESSSNAHYIKEAINVFDKIQQDQTGNFKNIAPYLVDAVRIGDFQYCQDWGIQSLNQENLTYSISENAFAYNEEVGKIDFNNFKKWDNDVIYNALDPSNSLPTRPQKSKIPLTSWKNLNTNEGIMKYNSLKYALFENKKKYGVDTRDALLDFIENGASMEFEKITRDNEARRVFMDNFSQESDRVYMAKLIAEKFVEKTYNEDGSLKTIPYSYQHLQIQRYLQDTYKKRGKEQLEFAIEELLLNDTYQSFSEENDRIELSILGKNSIFDVVSKPLVDELLNQRTINPEKDIALKKSIYTIECKYPSESGGRLAEIIKEYKSNNTMHFGYIPRTQRSEFARNFNKEEDLRDLVGIIANQYSKNYIDNRNSGNWNDGNSANNQIFNNLIENFGVDYFRENMIKGIIDNDYSGFSNSGNSDYLNNSNFNSIFQSLSAPYIQNTIVIGNVDKWYLENQDNIKNEELNDVAKKQRFSKFNSFINRLVQAKNKDFEERQ